jgi:hypothetical protein
MAEHGVILGSFGDKEDGMIPVKFSWDGPDRGNLKIQHE